MGYSYTFQGQERTFLWRDGTIKDLITLGGTSAIAYDINNGGQIVGDGGATRIPWGGPGDVPIPAAFPAGFRR